LKFDASRYLSRLKRMAARCRPRQGGRGLPITLLSVCAAAATLWMAFEVVRPQVAPALPPALDDAQPTATAAAPDGVRGLNVYLRAIDGRRLFQPPVSRTPTRRRAAPTKAPSISSKAAGLELAGLIGGDNPQAIIRDRKTGETYYVTAGQFIGDLMVKEVASGSVVLAAGDEEITIVL